MTQTVRYLNPNDVIATRQTKPPANMSRTGYGPKIGTSWELQLRDKRWRRVYVMQWSNLGTPYIVVDGKEVLLGTYDPSYEPGRGGGGGGARSAASAMIVGQWYQQIFRNGDASYFHAERVLKNGHMQGKAYFVDVTRPRAKAKGKQESVWAPELWSAIRPENVPVHRFA